MLFDSHCHFSDEAFDGVREELAEEIRRSEVAKIVDIGLDYRTSLGTAAAAERYEFCYASCGYYPENVGELTEELMHRTLDLYRTEKKVVAIGEIGLDYHYDNAPSRELQQLWFRNQIEMAKELGAPICIHSRDADGDTFRILRESGALGSIGVLLHCYSGSAELARQYVRLGAKISLAGPVTFRNARHSAEVAREIGLDNLLIETDSPYLAPVPLRGKQNKPVYVEHIARKIAQIKEVSFEEVSERTYLNACAFYGVSAE